MIGHRTVIVHWHSTVILLLLGMAEFMYTITTYNPNWGIGLYLPNSQKSLIILARQNKLLEVIKSMTIIESEMISHQQLFLSSQEP